jgi:hypothetical protein
VAANLQFDVSALDKASSTFLKLAAVIDRLERKLEDLDGKKVEAEVKVKTDKADREIGAFATGMQRRIAAAVKALPDIQLDADSSQADRKLAEIRAKLAEVADLRIGVDIDTDVARERVRGLEAELAQLGRQSSSVQVQADVGVALAQLRAVDAAVDALDGRTATVKVDVDKSLSDSLIKVAQLGRALGTLALPAAAILAAPQIASIGAAAVSASGSLLLLPAAGLAAAAAMGTLAVGLSHVSDALGPTGTPAQLKKVNEALAQLSPAARSAVEAVRGFGPAWSALRLDVQERLFAGLTVQVQKLGGAYLPIMRTALGGIATEMNKAAVGFANFALSGRTMDDTKTGLENTRKASASLAPILVNISEIFRDIAVVGSEFLPGLAQGFAGATDRAAAFVATARETGQLAQWIQQGITTITQLGRILGDVGGVLMDVFGAANNAGVSFLGTVERVTQGIRDFTSSAEGQATIVALFTGIREVVDAVWPGVERLAVAVGHVIQSLQQSGTFRLAGEAFTALANAVGPVLESLGSLASVILPPLLMVAKALAPVLVPLAVGLLAIKAATAGMAGLRAFPGWLLSAKTAAAGTTAATERLTTALGGLRAGVQQAGADMRASYQGASQAVRGFADQAGAAAHVASTALGERLAQAAQRGVDAVLRLPPAVSSAAATLRTGLGVAAIQAEQGLRRLPSAISSVASTLRTGLGVAAIDAATLIRQLPIAVASAASTLTTGLGVAAITTGESLKALGAHSLATGASLATGLRTGVTAAADGLRSLGPAALAAGQSLATGLQSGVAATVSGLRQVGPAAVAAGTSLAVGLRTGVTAAGEAVRGLPAQIGSAMTATGAAVATGLRSIPDHVRAAFAGIGGAVDTGISALGRFTGAIAGVGSSIGTGLMRAGSSLVGFLGGPWGAALAVAGVALSVFAAKQQEAAQKSADHKAQLESMVGTLDKYSGAVTQATVNEKASQLAKDGSLAKVRELGISVADYTQATLGNADALGRVQAQLTTHTRGLIESSDAYRTGQSELHRYGLTLDDLTAAAQGSAPAIAKVDAAALAAGKNGLISEGQFRGMAAAVLAAGGASAQLATDLGISNGALAQIQDQTRLAAEASGDFAGKLEFLARGLGGIRDGVEPTAQMKAGLDSLATSAQTAATAAGQSASALNGVGAGAAAAAQSMRASRDAFISAAEGAGLSAEAAARLADSIGLIPSAARTMFETNATAVAAELGALKAQFDAVPGSKSVTVQALTEDAKTRLSELGFTVTTLPNGQIQVTANTDQARVSLDGVVADAGTRTATVPIAGDPSQFAGTVSQQVTLANGQTATMTLNANPDPATGQITGTVAAANGAVGTITIDANPDPATGQIRAVVQLGNGSPTTITINPRDLASPVIRELERPTSSIHTINVNRRDTGDITAGAKPYSGPGAGGGLVGYAAGGMAPPRHFPRGGVIGGYAPGKDTVPAVLSKGEAVLVPELVRQIGARNILAANRAASGRQPTMWAGGGVARYATGGLARLNTGGPVNLAATVQAALGDPVGRASTAVSTAMQSLRAPAGADLGPVVAGLRRVEVATAANAKIAQQLTELAAVLRDRPATPINVYDQSGDPTEVARSTVLALRMGRR